MQDRNTNANSPGGETERITSTRDRILEAKESGLGYSVNSTPEPILHEGKIVGWFVTTTVTTIEINPRTSVASAYRDVDKNNKFTALETADTVSLGRALGKLGIGISGGFATSDEMGDEDNSQDNKEDNPKEDNPKLPKRKKSNKKEVVSKDGKKISVDMETGNVTHDKLVEAKLAKAEGDEERVKGIISDIKGEEKVSECNIVVDMGTSGITIPERIHDIRKLDREDVKEFVADLRSLGVKIKDIDGFIEEKGWRCPSGAVEDTLSNNFIRYADEKLLKEFYIKINNLKNK